MVPEGFEAAITKNDQDLGTAENDDPRKKKKVQYSVSECCWFLFHAHLCLGTPQIIGSPSKARGSDTVQNMTSSVVHIAPSLTAKGPCSLDFPPNELKVQLARGWMTDTMVIHIGYPVSIYIDNVHFMVWTCRYIHTYYILCVYIYIRTQILHTVHT